MLAIVLFIRQVRFPCREAVEYKPKHDFCLFCMMAVNLSLFIRDLINFILTLYFLFADTLKHFLTSLPQMFLINCK